MERLIRIWRYYFLRFKRLRGNPHTLALGTAIGVFIGLTPTIPFHTILILGLCLLTGGSFLAAVIISWIVCNPLTYVPIYYFSVKAGNAFTPYELNWERISHIIDLLLKHHDSFSESYHIILQIGTEATAVMVAGGIILATPFAVTSYYLSLYFFRKLALKRQQKRILQ